MPVVMSFAGFILAVMLHGWIMRQPVHIDSVRRFLLVGIPVGLLVIGLALTRFGLTIEAFASISLYALLCELYLFTFTLVISSVSATLLIMLRGGPIRVGNLAQVYDPRAMVELRLQRLIQNGFVERGRARLGLTERGLRVHIAFRMLRCFFGLAKQ